jgi:branched-chain amino acid transport system substrate-binding protein
MFRHQLVLPQIMYYILVLFILLAPTVIMAGDRHADVAVLLDLQGSQATLGQPAMNGFVLGLQQAHPLQSPGIFASLLDTQTDSEITSETAKRIVSAVSVAAGFTDNDAGLLVGPIFQKKKIPFVTIGATNPALPDIIGDHIFLIPFGDNAQAAAAAEFGITEFGSTVAILFDNTASYSRTLPQYFQTRFEELGGDVILKMAYPGGCSITSLGTQIQKLPTHPSFLYLAGLPDCIGEIIDSLRSAGVEQPILGGDGLDTMNLLSGNNRIRDKVWYTTRAWLSTESGTPSVKQFMVDYAEAYGSPPENAFAALGYDAANLLLDALKRADKVQAKKIFDALEETENYNGVTGTITFDEQSHVPLKTVWIIRVSDGALSLAEAFIPESVPPPIISLDE